MRETPVAIAVVRSSADIIHSDKTIDGLSDIREALGTADGWSDDTTEGVLDAAEETKAVGTFDGVKLGLSLKAMLGEPVGTELGILEGLVVGSCDGESDGGVLAVKLGCSEGVSD